MNAKDIFQMFGQGGMPGGAVNMSHLFGGGGGRPRRTKGENVGVRLGVPLSLLYTGGVKEISELQKTILCTDCKGSGSTSGVTNVCTDCRGKKVKLIRRAMGPGMIQQMQVSCDTCQAKGIVIPEGEKCTSCNGTRTKEVPRVLKVNIEPGMQSKTKIPFPGEGDEDPEIDEPGDIIVILEEKPDEVFTREREVDLVTEKTIPLQDALLGANFTLEHLDGRKIKISSPPGTVITPGLRLTLKGEGMPYHPKDPRSGKTNGDLHIVFSIDFPRTLDDDQINALKKSLPLGTQPAVPEDSEECFMDSYTPEEWKSMAKVGEDEEEDEEEADGPKIGGCTHQ